MTGINLGPHHTASNHTTMTKSTSELNPRTTHYEFAGPLGALFVTISVPFTTYALYYTCSETSGGCPPPLSSLPTTFIQAVTSLDWWKSLWDTQAFLVYIAWWAFCIVAWFVLPGDWVEGTTMRNGRKLKYKINGTLLFLPSLLFPHCVTFQLFPPFFLPLVLLRV